jgi:hypothetical protein
MGRLPRVKHIITLDDIAGVGGDKYSFYAPDIYGNFNSDTGVKKVATDDEHTYKGKLNSDDFKDGKAIKIKCRATRKNLAQQTITRDFTIVCATGKLKSALASLEDKKISIGGVAGVGSETWDIRTTRLPRRRRFS